MAGAAPADVWRLVRAELFSASAAQPSLLSQALSAADAARGDAVSAQNAAREAVSRAAEDALRRVGAATGAAVKQVDAAAAAARAEVSSTADAALTAALDVERRAREAGDGARGAAGHPSHPPAMPAQQPPTPAVSSSSSRPELGEFFRGLTSSLTAPSSSSNALASLTAALGGASSLPVAGAAGAAEGSSAQVATMPVGVPHIATGGTTWRVDGLPSVDKLRTFPPGKALESPPFAVGALHFILRLWPGGDGSKGSEGHVSLGLRLISPASIARVEYDLAVVNQSTGVSLARVANQWGALAELRCDSEEMVATGPCATTPGPLPSEHGGGGAAATAHLPPSPDTARWPTFVSHARVANFREELMRAGGLVVSARVTLASSGPQHRATESHEHRNQTGLAAGGHHTHHHAHNHPVPVPPRRLAADWGAMFASGEGVDVRFVLRPRTAASASGSASIHATPAVPAPPVTFAAHRLVLCARCTGMRTLLGGVAAAIGVGGGGLQQSTYEIGDCEPEAFGALLHFIYTDDVETRYDEHSLSTLLVLASRFEAHRLVGLAAHRLVDMLGPHNALRLALLGETHKCPALRKAATGVMKAHVDEVTSSQEWDHAIASHPRFMADLTRQLLPRGGAPQLGRSTNAPAVAEYTPRVQPQQSLEVTAILPPARGVVLRRDAYEADGYGSQI